MVRVSTLTMIAVLAIGIEGSAQAAPDLSGYWIIDARNVKQLSSVNKEDQSLQITQKGNTLTIRRIRGTWEFSLDGAERTNTPFGKPSGDKGFLGGTITDKSTVKVSGSTVTITTNGGAGEIAYETVEVFSLRTQGSQKMLLLDKTYRGLSPAPFESKAQIQYLLWPER